MQYQVKIISSRQELHTCSRFEIKNGLWGTSSFPETYGYLGFVPGEGFYLRMTCCEQNPYAVCTEQQGAVYRDSAMEMFLQFHPEQAATPYLNIEFNSIGAIHAKYGTGRKDRKALPLDGGSCSLVWTSHIKEDSWTEEVFLPLALLEEIYPGIKLHKGSTFGCNFYKISETPELEHYAAYSPIPVPTPDFHLPEFFAKAILV